MKFENIAYLLGAYFHQDWFYDSPTSDEVIMHFMSRESPSRSLALREEIKEFLSRKEEIPQTFIAEYDGYYDPAADGLSVRDWLENILVILSSEPK